MEELSTLTNISNQFNHILSHSPVFPNLNTITHSVSNPFLNTLVPDCPQKPSENNFLGIERLPTSSNTSKYDAFKSFTDIHTPLISEPFTKQDNRNTEHIKEDTVVRPDPFKDFAVSAFNEFKRDSQQQTFQQTTKLFWAKSITFSYNRRGLWQKWVILCPWTRVKIAPAVKLRSAQLFSVILFLKLVLLIFIQFFFKLIKIRKYF